MDLITQKLAADNRQMKSLLKHLVKLNDMMMKYRRTLSKLAAKLDGCCDEEVDQLEDQYQQLVKEGDNIDLTQLVSGSVKQEAREKASALVSVATQTDEPNVIENSNNTTTNCNNTTTNSSITRNRSKNSIYSVHQRTNPIVDDTPPTVNIPVTIDASGIYVSYKTYSLRNRQVDGDTNTSGESLLKPPEPAAKDKEVEKSAEEEQQQNSGWSHQLMSIALRNSDAPEEVEISDQSDIECPASEDIGPAPIDIEDEEEGERVDQVQDIADLDEHQNEDGRYRCAYLNCGKMFEKKRQMLKHRYRVHSKTVQCTWKGCRFRTKSSYMRDHVKRCHLKSKARSTGIFGKRRRRKPRREETDDSDSQTDELEDEMNNVLAVEEVDLTPENNQDEEQDQIEDEYQLSEGEMIFADERIGELGFDIQDIEQKEQGTSQHQAMKNRPTKPKTLECSYPGCDKKFGSRRQLYKHLQRHRSETVMCTWPGCESQIKAYYLRDHIRRVHRGKSSTASSPSGQVRQRGPPARNFVCDWPGCDRRYGERIRLERHLAAHRNEKPLVCDAPGCDFASRYPSSLMRHKMMVHLSRSEGEIVACSVQGCEFSGSPNALRSHINLVHLQKKFACHWPECEKRFISNRQLEDHMNYHLNEKPHQCNWPGCDFRTSDRCSLNIHRQRIHIKTGKHKCDWPGCEQSFYMKNEWRMHVLNHTGERPEMCPWPGCGRTFRTNGETKIHLRSHAKKSG